MTTSPTPTRQPFAPGSRRKLIISAAVNFALPALLYWALTTAGLSDFAALSAAAAVPAVWTLGRWVAERQLDRIGALATLGCAVAWLLALLLGGNALLLKVHGLLITGPLGLVLLASVAVGRPLLSLVMQVVMPERFSAPGHAQRLRSNPALRKKMATGTLVLGAALVLHALAVLVLAVELPTEAFLIAEKATTWGMIAVLLLVAFGLRRPSQGPAA